MLISVILVGHPHAPPSVHLPFLCGRGFRVSQAQGEGNHQGWDEHAWDFRMPEGEPVVAAADGVVRKAKGDSLLGGCSPAWAPFANYVVLTHAGGFDTQYLHLSRVAVKEGEHVKRGSLLGWVGKTGWACGAHLHFKVMQSGANGANAPSKPARWAGVGHLQSGHWAFASCRGGQILDRRLR